MSGKQLSIAQCLSSSASFLACEHIQQYRTGKTLGSGTYAIVKEAIHINTGKYYACKVINKKLMEGREYMVCLFTAYVGMRDTRGSDQVVS